MISRVIDAALASKKYLMSPVRESSLDVSVCVLLPEGDPVINLIRDADVVVGPEHDVLSRYMVAVEKYKPDYIVRITGDCPLLPPRYITAFIKMATLFGNAYVSNVLEWARLAPDGFDVEVISRSLMEYVNENALDAYDREHVTTYIRRTKGLPSQFKIANVLWETDQSALKLSVDTEHDLEVVRAEFEKLRNLGSELERAYGHGSVFRMATWVA